MSNRISSTNGFGAGIDLFAKETLANSYLSYGTESYGGTLKFGIPLREDFSVQLRYSLYCARDLAAVAI